MARLTSKDPAWWRRQHLKGTEVFIDCQMCPWHGVDYQMWRGGWASRSCTNGSHRNLDYWGMATAPCWCPLRKKNGGRNHW